MNLEQLKIQLWYNTVSNIVHNLSFLQINMDGRADQCNLRFHEVLKNDFFIGYYKLLQKRLGFPSDLCGVNLAKKKNLKVSRGKL